MHICRTGRLPVGLTVVCLATAVCAASVDELLSSRDWERRVAALQQIRQERQQLIEQLMERLRKRTPAPQRTRPESEGVPYEERHLTILLLGELRAAEATDLLLQNLAFRCPEVWHSKRIDTGGWYPAADALRKIGKPAVRPAIHKLAISDDELERELCCWIIEQVEGEELAPIVLQLAIDKEQYSSRKKRLQAALAYLQKEQ